MRHDAVQDVARHVGTPQPPGQSRHPPCLALSTGRHACRTNRLADAKRGCPARLAELCRRLPSLIHVNSAIRDAPTRHSNALCIPTSDPCPGMHHHAEHSCAALHADPWFLRPPSISCTAPPPPSAPAPSPSCPHPAPTAGESCRRTPSARLPRPPPAPAPRPHARTQPRYTGALRWG